MANIVEERAVALVVAGGAARGVGLLIDNNKELYFN
jgi:hypothetical protein